MTVLEKDNECFIVHGTYVAVNERAYLLVGDSAAGKTTLALKAESLGHEFVADDAVAFRVVEGRALGSALHKSSEEWRLDGIIRCDDFGISEILAKMNSSLKPGVSCRSRNWFENLVIEQSKEVEMAN